MLETGTSGLMSGAGKRGGVSASVLAPGLDSTRRLDRGVPKLSPAWHPLAVWAGAKIERAAILRTRTFH